MKKYLYIALLTLSLSPAAAMAQAAASTNPVNNPPAQYTALEPLPCIPGNGITCASTGGTQTQFSFQNYLQYLFNLIIAVAAAAAVFMITYGGFQYMTTDSWEGKKGGLEKVKGALLGLVLILTSYLILRTIDPRLVAIPSTLVKPLNIGYHDYDSLWAYTSSVDSFAAQALQQSQASAQAVSAARQDLAKDSNDVQNLMTAAINTAKSAQQAAGMNPSTYATTIAGACNDLRASWETPDVVAACSAYKAAVQRVHDDSVSITTVSAQSIMDQKLSDCLKQKDINVSDCNARIDSAAAQAKNILVNDLSTDPRAISDYEQYAKGMVAITNRTNNWVKGGTISGAAFGSLIDLSNGYLNQISDPAVKAKLVVTRDKFITDRGGQQSLIDDGTYLKQDTAKPVYDGG
jgi:hypothetical protein